MERWGRVGNSRVPKKRRMQMHFRRFSFPLSCVVFLHFYQSDSLISAFPSPLLSYFRNGIWIAFRDHASCLILIEHDGLCVCAGAAAFMSKVTVVPVRFFQTHLRFTSIFGIETNEIFPKVYLHSFIFRHLARSAILIWITSTSRQWLLYRWL